MTPADLTTFVKKNPIAIGGCVIAIVFAVAAYYRGSAADEAKAMLGEKVVESARIAGNVKNAKSLTEQMARLTAAANEIKQRRILASDLANNLQYFYRLEAETGTKIVELRQNPTSAKAAAANTAVGVSFSLSLQGEYTAVLEVLRRLESGEHYCRVMSANLAAVGPSRDTPIKLALGLELLGSQ